MATANMQRRHFEVIAEALRVSKPNTPERPNSADLSVKWQWTRSVHVMADALDRTNPNFNRERFYAACGETE